MPACSTCTHPKRAEIDRLLARGEGSRRRVAAQYGLSEPGLRRHSRRHLDPVLVAAGGLETEVIAREALEHCRWLVGNARTQAEKILARDAKLEGVVCPACGQRPAPFKEWIDPLNRAIQSLGKFTGELANDQLNAFFVEMGVRSGDELRSRVAISRGGEELSPADAQDEAVATLEIVWRKHPELREHALARLERASYALVEHTNGHTNGGSHAEEVTE